MALLLILGKATALLAIALGVALALHRASAGARHLVWLVALVALLALPAVAVWSPLHVRVLPAAVIPSSTHHLDGAAALPDEIGVTTAGTITAPVTPSALAATRWWRGVPLTEWLAIGWALVACTLLGWLAIGSWQVRRIVRRASPLLDAAWQGPLYEIADRMHLTAAPTLVRSTDVRMPFACGLLHCTIVLPAESDEWTAERRSAVLIHELAHVRRRDLIGHTLGRLACAFYWFHPLVWSAARHLRAESERACDDLALTYGARPSDYAEHLLDIVTCVRDHATPSVALAMAHRKEFEGRMLAILDPGLKRLAPGRVQASLLVGSLALLAVVISAAKPMPRTSATATHDDRTRRQPEEAPVAGNQTDGVTSGIRSERRSSIDAVVKAHPPGSDTEAVQDTSARVAALLRALQDDSVPAIRRIAAWGLADHSDADDVARALVRAANDDRNAAVRAMAVWALAESGSDHQVEQLESIARRDSNGTVREMAIWALGTHGIQSAVPLFESVLEHDGDRTTRETAVWALGSAGIERISPAIVRALADSDPEIRLRAAWAAGEAGDSTALPAIRAALRRDQPQDVKRALLRALMHSHENPERLAEWLRAPDPALREAAMRAVTGANSPDPWPWPMPRPIPFP